MRFGTSVALLATMAGCRTFSATPAQGGAAWREVQTEHFVVWTDLPEPAARQRAAYLEDFRRFYVAAMFAAADKVAARTLVIVVARDDDWNLTIEGERARYDLAMGAAESPTLQPLMATPAGDERGFYVGMVGAVHGSIIRTTTVELAPAIAPRLVGGLAEYLGSARRDGRAWVVDDFGATLKRYRRTDKENTRELLEVAYLDSEHRERFAAYLGALRGGASGLEAWKAAFPELDLQRLDAEVDRWAEKGHMRDRRLELPELDRAGFATRVLSEADVFAARALLSYLLRPTQRAEAMRPDVDRALGEDPTHSLATLLLQELTPAAVDAARARRVAAAHPDDFHALVMLVRTVDDAAEREALTAKLCAVLAPSLVTRRTGASCGPPSPPR